MRTQSPCICLMILFLFLPSFQSWAEEVIRIDTSIPNTTRDEDPPDLGTTRDDSPTHTMEALSATEERSTNAMPPIITGSEIGYPPFCLVDTNGNAAGFSVELFRAVAQRMEREVVFKTGLWNDIKTDLAEGRLDALPLVGRTPERLAIYDFTVPYMTMHGTIVVRKDTTDIHSLADLAGRHIGVMRGDNADEFLHRQPFAFTHVETDTFWDALKLLSEGKCDAVVMQRLLFLQLVKEHNITNLVSTGPMLKDFVQPFCFAVKKGNSKLLATLNEGLAIVQSDGTYRSLHEKWFGALMAGSKSDVRIIVGGDDDYPPYEYLDEHGQPAGLNVELTRAIARTMGLKVEIRLGTWHEMLREMEEGRIDIMQGMFFIPERADKYRFSQGHNRVHQVAVTRKGSATITDAEDLLNKKILVMSGDIMHDWAVSQGLESQLLIRNTMEDALRDLSAGTADCALMAKTPAVYWIEKYDLKNLEVGHVALLQPEYCYAALTRQDELLADFNEGLTILQKTGELHTIRQKWITPYDQSVKNLWHMLTYVGIASGALLILLAGALIWSRTLQRRIAVARQKIMTMEDRNRLAMEATSDGIWDWNLQDNSVFWSPRCYTMLGYAPNEFPMNFEQWRALLHPDDLERAEKSVRYNIIEKGELMKCEFRLKTKQDSWLWILSRGRPATRNLDGNITRTIGTHVDISERKAAEERYEMLFREMLDAFALHEIILDDDGVPVDYRFLAVNPAFEHHTGLSESMVQGKTVREVLPETEAKWIRRYGEVALTGQPTTFIEYSKALDRYFDVRAFSPAKGQFAVIFMDITERKKAEEAQAHLLSMLESSLNEIYVFHPESLLFEYVNESARHNLGYDMSKLKEMTPLDLKPDYDEQTFRKMISGLLENRIEKLVFETTHKRADGTCYPIEVHLQTVLQAEEIRFLAIIHDITERHEAQERLKIASIEWQNTFDAMSDMIAIIEPDLRITRCNRAMHDFFGKVPLIGEYCYRIFHGTDHPPEACLGHCVLKEGREQHLEVQEAHLGGRWLSINIYPIRDERGVVKKMVHSVTDITKQKELEAHLRQREKMDAIGQLAGGIAHDFNNQLGGILGYAEMLAARLPDKALQQYAQSIILATQRAAELTSQLLAFSRKGKFLMIQVDLHATITEVVSLLSHSIDKRISIQQCFKTNTALTMGDPTQLQNAILNLALNARDAMPNGGELIFATRIIALKEKALESDIAAGDYIELSITDTGCGMSPDVKKHLFEPFFTTKPVGKGTGLGLASVFGTVKSHRGAIHIYSEPDKGTTAKIYLPICYEVSGSQNDTKEPLSPDTTHARLLIVDDEEIVREMSAALLRDYGFDVIVFGDPAKAIAYYQNAYTDIDLAIIDMVMPQMNGRELFHTLREINPSIKALLSSGYGLNGEAQGALNDGVLGFVQKPYHTDDLLTAITHALHTE